MYSIAGNQLVILQISDIHGAIGLENMEANDSRDRMSRLRQALEDRLERELRGALVDVVVINGDISNRGDSEQLAVFEDEFLGEIKNQSSFVNSIFFAVPGNHDVLRESKEWLTQFRTNLKASVDEMPFGEEGAVADLALKTNDAKVQFWLANSISLRDVKNSRDFEPEALECGYIKSNVMGRARAKLDEDSLKIAVFHHNPVPFSGEGVDNNAPRRYGFINSGDVNEFLADNSFRLVLHGHQHKGAVNFFARQRDETAGNSFPNIIDDGFLSVGAPSLGADSTPGFHLLTVTCDSSSSFAEVEIVRCDLKSDHRISSRFLAPIKRLGALEKELLFKATTSLYVDLARNAKHRRIARCLSDSSVEAERRFFRNLRETRTEAGEIRAIYSLTVFEPQKWGAKRLGSFHLPEGTKNIARAIDLAEKSGEEGPALKFSFSSPLHKGINTAKNISKSLRVGSTVWTAWNDDTSHLIKLLSDDHLSQGREFLDLSFRGELSDWNPSNDSDSLSIWDNTTANESSRIGQLPRIGTLRVVVEDRGVRPSFDFGAASERSKIEGLMEFPRILLWDSEYFLHREAMECIVFHEECGFPLFWLDPERLLDCDGEKRGPYGSLTILALKSHFRDGSEWRQRGADMWNDEDGELPSSGELFKNAIRKIWNGHPPGPLVSDSYFLDEFLYLLERPDIMFAADVWAFKAMGADYWDALQAHLRKTDEQCRSWAENRTS